MWRNLRISVEVRIPTGICSWGLAFVPPGGLLHGVLRVHVEDCDEVVEGD
ncbi:MAG: hypothetical protein AABX40_04470 [Candidatus Hydrothermarchaeota archaeon]